MRFTKHAGLIFGLLSLFFCGALAPTAQAATYYVDAVNGNDSTAAFDPATSSKPYRTFAAVLYRASFYFSRFGVDTIIVEPGVYNEAFSVRQNGLTVKARYDATATTTQRSILRPSGPDVWQLVTINASNVSVRGLELDGSNAYVDTGPGAGTKDTGITSYGNPTGGVQINGQHTDSSNNVIPAAYHVNISHCVVHDCGGGGMGTQNGNYNASADLSSGPTGGPDYVTLEDNVIYNTCFTGKYAGSGISYHGNSNSNPADTGFHCFIRRNRIYGNIAKFSGPDFFGEAKHTDGNGIIIDFCGQQNPPTLIENNLIYKNGGRGIHAFNSSNVTGRNNTLYKNNQDPDIAASGGGELTAISAHDVLYSNNIVYGVGGAFPAFVAKVGYAYGQAGGVLKNIAFRANTYWGSGSGSSNIAAGIIDWNTTFNQNPLLHAPDSGDFTIDMAAPQSGKTLVESQSVIDRASTTAGECALDDVQGALRPATDKDRGAHERPLPVPSPVSPPPPGPSRFPVPTLKRSAALV